MEFKIKTLDDVHGTNKIVKGNWLHIPIEEKYTNILYRTIINSSQNNNIEFTQQYIKQKYSDMDYILYDNYFIVSDNKLPESNPSDLKKLTIIMRHGNRMPVNRLKYFEKNLNENIINNDAMLLPSGKKTCENLFNQIDTYYKINKLNVKIFSSPAQRCIDTVSVLSSKYNDNIKIDPNLFYSFNKPFYNKSLEIDEVQKFINDNQDIIKELEQMFEMDLSNPVALYDLYSSLNCYKELNYNVDEYILNTVKTLIEKFYNIYYKHYNIYNDTSGSILKYLLDMPASCNIMCTHDSLLFCLVKYIQKINNLEFDVSLPIYCSCIFIEEYENMKRIFYNNHYIGNIY